MTGKVVRGRIGVSGARRCRAKASRTSASSRARARSSRRSSPGGAAAKAGIEPGDVIVEYNGRPVPSSDDLVKMVVATKPGTSVPVKVMREQAGEDAARHRRRARSRRRAAGAAPGPRQQQQPEQHRAEQGSERLRPDAAEPDAADRAAAAAAVGPVRRGDHRRRSEQPVGARRCAPGDVILSVNRKAVSSARRRGTRAAEGRVGPPRADPALARRRASVFVTVKKE